MKNFINKEVELFFLMRAHYFPFVELFVLNTAALPLIKSFLLFAVREAGTPVDRINQFREYLVEEPDSDTDIRAAEQVGNIRELEKSDHDKLETFNSDYQDVTEALLQRTSSILEDYEKVHQYNNGQEYKQLTDTVLEKVDELCDDYRKLSEIVLTESEDNKKVSDTILAESDSLRCDCKIAREKGRLGALADINARRGLNDVDRNILDTSKKAREKGTCACGTMVDINMRQGLNDDDRNILDASKMAREKGRLGADADINVHRGLNEDDRNILETILQKVNSLYGLYKNIEDALTHRSSGNRNQVLEIGKDFQRKSQITTMAAVYIGAVTS